MKKLVVMLALALSTQLSFAQTAQVNPIITEFIEAQGLKQQLLSAKESLNEYILESNKDAFTKDYDTTVDKFIVKFGNVVSKNFSNDEISNLVKSIKEQKEFEGFSEEKQKMFESDVQVLQTEFGMEINELIMQYGNPELFEQ